MTEPPAPWPGERSLSCVDWNAFAAELADRLTHLLTAGGDHLIGSATLRAHTVEALLAVGVHAHEITLDHRTPTGRAPLWMALDTGICATIDVIHCDHHTTPRTQARRLTTTITRAAAIPAHEHITLTLTLPAETTALHRAHWPSTPGETGVLPHTNHDLELVCQTHTKVADHNLILWTAERILPAYPLITNTQPHLFPLPGT